MDEILTADIDELTARMLAEDVGRGDLTAALIDADTRLSARVITREPMVLAGRPWVDALFRATDKRVELDWAATDGDRLEGSDLVFRVRGPARAILTVERSALNILQTLSATATTTAAYVSAIEGTGCRVLDTRKTIPGLRLAQKYAVRCGGGSNHRCGLYDAVLIKENHIAAAGSIGAAVAASRTLHPDAAVEVEVESLGQLAEALDAAADQVLLDNFMLDDLRKAVTQAAGATLLEASGDVTLDSIRAMAETGVDYISVGALTKHVRAIDLSMRFEATD